MAACMADNAVQERCIGLIWDGTGLGEDGTVWGGECLIGDYLGFERFGSVRPIPLIGGDRATEETDRVAFALLREAGCDTASIPNAEQYGKMLDSGFSCPPSSGMGRPSTASPPSSASRPAAATRGRARSCSRPRQRPTAGCTQLRGKKKTDCCALTGAR